MRSIEKISSSWREMSQSMTNDVLEELKRKYPSKDTLPGFLYEAIRANDIESIQNVLHNHLDTSDVDWKFLIRNTRDPEIISLLYPLAKDRDIVYGIEADIPLDPSIAGGLYKGIPTWIDARNNLKMIMFGSHLTEMKKYVPFLRQNDISPEDLIDSIIGRSRSTTLGNIPPIIIGYMVFNLKLDNVRYLNKDTIDDIKRIFNGEEPKHLNDVINEIAFKLDYPMLPLSAEEENGMGYAYNPLRFEAYVNETPNWLEKVSYDLKHPFMMFSYSNILGSEYILNTSKDKRLRALALIPALRYGWIELLDGNLTRDVFIAILSYASISEWNIFKPKIYKYLSKIGFHPEWFICVIDRKCPNGEESVPPDLWKDLLISAVKAENVTLIEKLLETYMNKITPQLVQDLKTLALAHEQGVVRVILDNAFSRLGHQ